MVWGYSNDKERYYGTCKTKEEAIEEGKREYPDEEKLWIAKGQYVTLHELMGGYDSEWFREHIQEAAYDAVGDVAQDFAWENLTKEADIEFQEMLLKWATKWLTEPDFWRVVEQEEIEIDRV